MPNIGIAVISNFPITVTNSGTVAVAGTDSIGVFASSPDGGDMSSTNPPDDDAFTLTNNAGGVIQAGGVGVKLLADATHGATGTFVVVNAGTIKSTGSGQAIDFSDLTSPTQTTITNQATGLIQAANGDAIQPGANATIDNYGQIVSLSSGDGINFQSHSGGVVNNFVGATIHGANAGITALAAITVYNEGTIQGGGGQAISITDTLTDTITNKGTIIGGISTGGGDDVLNLYTGSSISGLSDGGDGMDTISLFGTGTGTLSNLADFEDLNVQTGSWTITNSASFAAGIAIAAGAVLQVGNGGTAGALGGDVADDGVFTFDRSDTVTFAGVISGSGIVQQIGTGTTILTGHNTYSGGTEIASGTLDVVASDGAGTGTITFEAGAQILRIENTALSGDHFANTIDGFSNQSTIDLAGIGLATSATLGAGNVLTISGGAGGPITLQLDPGQDFADEAFSVTSDGAGGTNVTLAQVISGSGDGTITGTPGNDIINAGNGSSTIIAGQGNDTIVAGNGTDSVIAGNGNNTISLGSGSDTVTAGNGNNVISGGNGPDIVTVGNGNNTIDAGNGADVLKVGTGNNTLTGGNGGDSFVFGPDFGKNVITDFGHGDQIEFDGGVFADFHAVQAASHQVGTDTVIGLDADHSITLVGVAKTSLHASDFILH
jgi:autotransporter-associated beta strand protein